MGHDRPTHLHSTDASLRDRDGLFANLVDELEAMIERGREDRDGERSPGAKLFQPKLSLLPAFVGGLSMWPSNTSSYLDIVTAVDTCHHCCGDPTPASITHTFLALCI